MPLQPTEVAGLWHIFSSVLMSASLVICATTRRFGSSRLILVWQCSQYVVNNRSPRALLSLSIGGRISFGHCGDWRSFSRLSIRRRLCTLMEDLKLVWVVRMPYPLMNEDSEVPGSSAQSRLPKTPITSPLLRPIDPKPAFTPSPFHCT